MIALRFSIVAPLVPFLVSKFVFKRLGGVLDLDANEFILKRLGKAIEPLHDLVSGHVGLELVKKHIEPPVVAPSTFDLCRSGDEVSVDKLVANVIYSRGRPL